MKDTIARVSVVNFCSTAVHMLNFSTETLQETAGELGYDYIVVTWNPSLDVVSWLDARPGILRASYRTREDLAYVPNLRCMMSMGFDEGYRLNDYVCPVNTDMMFGRNWLQNLAMRATPDVIPNSRHITPIRGPRTVRANFGVPTFATFQSGRFWALHDKLYEAGRFVTPEDLGGDWRTCATFPYVMHRRWWERYGPWEPNLGDHEEAPDRRFFGRCAAGGARFIMCYDSICYHHEAVERRGEQRPIGIETMPEGL